MDSTLALSPALTAPPSSPPGGLRWPRTAVTVLGLWSAPAAVALGQVYLQQVLTAEPVDWNHALWTTLPNWYLWALLTPLVVVLARRAAPGRSSWARIVAVHLPGMVGLLALHAVGNVLVFAAAGLPAEASWAVFWTHYTIRFHVNVLAYGLAVAAVWMLDGRRRASERARQESSLRVALAEAELRALRMQLRPHFLFNTLHAIGATVRKGETESAVTMLSHLGDLLRLALEHDDAQTAPLRQEVDLLERYLALERIRFGDRLTVSFDIAPEALRAAVPLWILQPLVENALKYAIAPDPGPGRIAIRARKDDDRVILEVQDSGPGLGAATSLTPSHGVGLANTQERLALLYGGDATLEFIQADGLLVRLTLPYRAA